MKYKIVEEPHEIEKKSMATIEAELNGRTWPEPEFSVIKRCIHTSADFDYADNIVYSKDAVKIGIEALKNGAAIVTDTKMAASGINKTTSKTRLYGSLLRQRRRRRRGSQRERVH